MTQPSDQHAADSMVGPHGQATDHGDDHGHDDHGHAPDAETLGPLDPQAWGAGLLGIILGLAVAVAFLVANGLPI